MPSWTQPAQHSYDLTLQRTDPSSHKTWLHRWWCLRLSVTSTPARDSSSKYSLGSDTTLAFGRLGRWPIFPRQIVQNFLPRRSDTDIVLYRIAVDVNSVLVFALLKVPFFVLVCLAPSRPAWSFLFLFKNMSMYPRFALCWKCHTSWIFTTLYPISKARSNSRLTYVPLKHNKLG